MVDWRTPMEFVKPGTGRKLREGDSIAVLSIGHIGNYAIKALDKLELEGIRVAHFDLRYIKPLDENLLHEVFSKYKRIITLEDAAIQGGMGSAVLEFMADHNYSAQVKRLGIPDAWIEHGTQDELYAECGYDETAIRNAVLEFVRVEI
jgi:1-deoxy-D-xylulose-5-phosphate synthase